MKLMHKWKYPAEILLIESNQIVNYTKEHLQWEICSLISDTDSLLYIDVYAIQGLRVSIVNEHLRDYSSLLARDRPTHLLCYIGFNIQLLSPFPDQPGILLEPSADHDSI